ncbi:MAG: hypothetical protein U1F54_05560 [Burkholderiales bacterium]
MSNVPVVEGIDPNFRPTSYFFARDHGLALPSDIQGMARRELARQLAAEGRDLPEELAGATLTDDDRRAWGRMHPSMMGGEYLPPMHEDEVEIARISLASVTADQISVRARRVDDGIAFRIVDEYDEPGECRYEALPEHVRETLTLSELVEMLDNACDRGGAVLSHVVWNIEDGLCGVDEMRRFVSVESDFYPDLGRYYAARLDSYFASLPKEEDEGEEA